MLRRNTISPGTHNPLTGPPVLLTAGDVPMLLAMDRVACYPFAINEPLCLAATTQPAVVDRSDVEVEWGGGITLNELLGGCNYCYPIAMNHLAALILALQLADTETPPRGVSVSSQLQGEDQSCQAVHGHLVGRPVARLKALSVDLRHPPCEIGSGTTGEGAVSIVPRR